jgi:hypothetical protein
MAKPKDITELRDQLLDAFDALKGDPRRMLQTKELANAAGKIIGTVKSQLEYSLLRGEEPEIPFMGKTSGRALKSNAKALTS